MANMELIETKTVGAGGASNIEFTGLGSYSSTYTDLYLVCSLRTDGAFTADNLVVQFNGSSSNFTAKNIYGTGSGTPVSQSFTTGEVAGINAANTTANTFSNTSIYIPNFSSSNYKSISTDSGIENNATRGDDSIYATLWSNTAAITSIRLVSAGSANFVQYSSVSLYGISAVPSSPKATGGIVSQDATYWYHTFPFSSTFTPTTALSADILCVAGGGGAAYGSGGGAGGAGGLLTFTSQSLSATNYTVTIGAGGATPSSGNVGTQGGNSQFGSLTASVGGGRGGWRTTAAGGGGSGGGAGSQTTTETGGSGTSGQGNAGGNSVSNGYRTAGGGGAGAAGANATSSQNGAGGIGATSSLINAIGAATFTGEVVGSTYYYAGGGGAGGVGSGAGVGTSAGGLGGLGGGGRGALASGQTGLAGLPNTGGGGGSGWTDTVDTAGGSGGSGVVIVRYAK